MSDMSDFEQWLIDNMPSGTVIGDPKWWAPKLLQAAKQSMQGEAVAIPWMTNGLFVITFDDFVEYGRKSGANIVNGMPWSFKFDGIPVTHETDTCYLLCRHPNDLRLTPNTVLIKFADGSYSVQDKNTTFSDYPFLRRLPTHAPDSAARIAELEAENAKLKMAIEYDQADDDAEWEPPHPIFQLAQERDNFMFRVNELEAENEAQRKGKDQALYLPWNYVSESLPPGAENHWFSPKVWLALSDGRVMPGQCLHKVKNAIYEDPVHAWFIFEENGGPGLMLSDGVDVVAWMPFAKPDHPGIALPTIDASLNIKGGAE